MRCRRAGIADGGVASLITGGLRSRRARLWTPCRRLAKICLTLELLQGFQYTLSPQPITTDSP